MEPKQSNTVPAVIAMLVVIPVLYFGSYYALLKPRPFVLGAGTIYPDYKVGGEVSRFIFSPASQIHLWLDRVWYGDDESPTLPDL